MGIRLPSCTEGAQDFSKYPATFLQTLLMTAAPGMRYSVLCATQLKLVPVPLS